MRSSRLCLLIAVPLIAAACDGSETSSRVADDLAPARVAEIVCDSTHTTVRTRLVVARPDGVHIRFVNESATTLAYQVEDDRTGGRGGSVPRGSSSHVVPLAPGRLRIRCYDESNPDAGGRTQATFNVVDSNGVWTSTVLECDENSVISSLSIDHLPGLPGERGTPTEVARSYLERSGLGVDGKLERAGYPAVSPTLVRLVRKGAVVALVSLVRLEGGGYLVEQLDRCEPPRR